jgi:hypothetical protein
MSNIFYKSGGPIVAGSRCYVSRDADETASTYLRRMEYITLVEPRQQGKTSLINKLIGRFTTQGFTFAVRDLTAAKSSGHSASDWYTSVGSWLSRQLHFIPEGQRPAPPVNSGSWEEFLATVAEKAEAAGRNVVIVLDEVGAIPEGLATDFFSVIRSVYATRQSLSFWNHLTFIISGAFNPKDLIKDKIVSNFNVHQRVVLADFDIGQIQKLVDLLNFPVEWTKKLARRIHYWTDGQPYLTEHMCLYVSLHRQSVDEASAEATVDNAVEHFFREDTHHLARIRELVADPGLLTYAKKITGIPRARFSASLNDKQFLLAHVLGVIKADSEGRCRVRNLLYERAIAEGERAYASEYSQNSAIIEVFCSYSHKDEKLRDKLQKHLAMLRHDKKVIEWHDRRIGAGTEWESEIDKHLNGAAVILLLISADFLASKYCYDIEVMRAMERHEAGKACVIPIILRPVDWSGAIFGKLQALPKNGQPVALWGNRDAALMDVAKGIREAVESLAARQAQ